MKPSSRDSLYYLPFDFRIHPKSFDIRRFNYKYTELLDEITKIFYLIHLVFKLNYFSLYKYRNIDLIANVRARKAKSRAQLTTMRTTVAYSRTKHCFMLDYHSIANAFH